MSEEKGATALRLPKLVEADARADALRDHLGACSRPLWPGATQRAVEAPLSRELRDILVAAEGSRRLVRGLEACDLALDSEARGQQMADDRSATRRNVRISRLLLLSADGSERFYRQVERTLRRHEGRVLAIRLAVDADALGELLFGPTHPTRALMLIHKQPVAEALLTLLP